MPLEIGKGKVDHAERKRRRREQERRQSPPVRGEQGSKVPASPIRDEGTQVGRRPYQGSTNPAFQRVGFSGDIFALNRRVEAANYAFETQFGFAPSPGLLMDLVRAPVQTEEYVDLFAIPSSFQRARALGALQADVQSAVAIPKTEGGPYQDAIRVEEYEGQRSEDIQEGMPDLAAAGVMGFEFRNEVSAFEKYAFGVPTLAVSQVVEALASAPAGLIVVTGAAGGDVWDVRKGDFSFSSSREIGRQMIDSVVEDFRHPLENPGFLFLDVLGAASGGAGGAARVGAARRAARATEAVGRGADVPSLDFAATLRPETLNRVALGQTGRAVISALVRRPLPGTYVIGPKGAEERVLLSENALRRGAQRAYYANLQRKLMERIDAPPPSSLPPPRTRSEVFWAEMNRHRKSVFSYETTLSRHAAARMRAERKTFMAPIHEWERANRATSHLADTFKRLPLVGKREKGVEGVTAGPGAYGLSVGDQMAILFDATGGPDPVGFWRNWHTKMLEWGQGDAAAHKAKLAAVDLGEQAWANPNKRLKRAIEASRRLSQEQEALKIKYLGLDETTAINRVNTERAVLQAATEATSKSDFFRRVNDTLGGPPLSTRLDDAWYYPQPKRGDVDVNPLGPAFGSRSSGKFGHPVPNPSRLNPELNHRFEAKAIMSGDTVVDARNLAGKYAAVGKSVSAINDWNRLVALSVERPNAALTHQRGFLRPVRTLEGVPDELRKRLEPFYEDRIVTGEEASQLSKGKHLDDLHAWLFPDYVIVDGVPRLATGESIAGVRWVDERLSVDLHRYPGEPSFDAKFMQAVSDPLRALTLYARLGYSMNAVSNAGMLLIHQKHLAPVSMYKSLTAGKRYGRRALVAIDRHIDEGKARSFTPEDMVGTKISRSFANVWSVIVDRWMRRAAFIYEMERRGYRTQEQVENLLDPKNDKLMAERVEISQRSNKVMVEFDNLTWFEKNRLRHYIFVYPWVSRSTVWAVRTMLDRPLTTWAVSELAQIGEEYVEETLEDVTGWATEKLPNWLDGAGYIPTGGFDKQGNPLVVNANSTNTFSTLNDLMRTGKGAITDDPLYSLEDMLGPLPELFLRSITGRNQYGQKYEHGAFGGIGEVVSGLPPFRGWARPKRDEGAEIDPKTGKPKAVRSSLQLLTKPGQARSPEDRPVLIPGMDSWYAPLISSGLFPPKGLDIEAAAERYWQEQPEEERDKQRAKIQEQMLREKTKWEILSIRHAEDITARILGKAVPRAVKDIIGLQAQFQNAYLDYAVQGKKGRMPTEAEQRYIQIDVLKNMGRITPDVAQTLVKDLGKALNRGRVEEFSDVFSEEYLNRRALLDWHRERDTVLEISNNITSQVDYLKKSGLFAGALPKATNLIPNEPPTGKTKLPGVSTTIGAKQNAQTFTTFVDTHSPVYQVGRAYAEFEKTLKAREPADTSALEGVSGAQHKMWQDEQDKDIKINGVSYPSPVRLKWASDVLRGTLDDPDYEVKKLSALSVQGWGTLTNFEKEVVGKKVPAGVSAGWLAFEAVTGGYRGNVFPDDLDSVTLVGTDGDRVKLSDYVPGALDSDVSKEHKIAIAKWVDKNFAPGFYKDFLFSLEPKVHRVRVLPIIKKSAVVGEWRDILGNASTHFSYIKQAREIYDSGGKPPKTIGALEDEWKAYVREFYSYIQEEGSDTFKKELELLGGVDFLRTLIAD